jgi:hypothetical protein
MLLAVSSAGPVTLVVIAVPFGQSALPIVVVDHA